MNCEVRTVLHFGEGQGQFPSEIEVEAIPNVQQTDALRDPSFWQRAQGKYSRTYDQTILGKQILELLGLKSHDGFLLLITDQEITPPPEWRYIIWDSIPDGAVISLATTDPQYWRESGDLSVRMAIVKHRVRTAGLSVVGNVLGLTDCHNDSCFLFADVDSVTTLDEMVFLGPEHELPELARRGFATRPSDPR